VTRSRRAGPRRSGPGRRGWLPDRLRRGRGRVAAGRARDAAAVRAGAIILDVVDTSLAAEYRRLFLDAIGGRAFDTAYPLSNEAEMELRRLVTSAAAGAVPGRTSYEN
jgi:hypothetical protein